MNLFPNQKKVIVNKAEANASNLYCILNLSCMYEAMRELKYNEFKIFMYLASNQDGFETGLSSVDIANKTGANQRKIQESINTLIEKGYLTLREGTTKTYDFNEKI